MAQTIIYDDYLRININIICINKHNTYSCLSVYYRLGDGCKNEIYFRAYITYIHMNIIILCYILMHILYFVVIIT